MGCGQSSLPENGPTRKQTRKHAPRLSDTGAKHSGSESSVDRNRSSRGSKRGVSRERTGSRSSRGSKGGKEWSGNASGASTGSAESSGRQIRRSQSDHFADRLTVNASKTNVADMYDIGHTLGARCPIRLRRISNLVVVEGRASLTVPAIIRFQILPRDGIVRGGEVCSAQGDASAGEEARKQTQRAQLHCAEAGAMLRYPQSH